MSQLLIYHFLIYPIFESRGIDANLIGYLLPLFTLVTVILAAAGYVINDIFDLDADLTNKPKKTIVGHYWPKSKAYAYYYILLVFGLALSIYIALKIERPALIAIYPLAAALLFGYSAKWKKDGLMGNIIVALFTAFVSAILLVAEPMLLHSPSPLFILAGQVIIAFSIFSFIINFLRELVKDIEDMDGDQVIGSKSVAISQGVNQTKVVMYFNTVFLIAILIGCQFYFESADFRTWTYMILFLIAPLAISLLKLHKARLKFDYHRLSTLYKWIMLSGLIFLLLTAKSMLI